MKTMQRMSRLFAPRQTSVICMIDGRLKLFWLTTTVILSLALQTSPCLCLLFGSTLIYSFLAKVVRQHLFVLKYSSFFSLLALALMLLVANEIQSIREIALRVFARLCIMSSAGILFALSTSPRDLLQSLQRMQIPNVIVFPLTTALRFIPALLKEIGEITDALKLRGMEPGLRLAIRHPVRCYRSILIPLTIRSITISGELAAAAESRGMGSPIERTSLHIKQPGKRDYLFLCAVAVFSMALLLADHHLRRLL